MTEAVAAAQPSQATEPVPRPYPPSWVDRVTAWVERRPGPSWAYYLGAWLVLFSLYTAVKWRDGAYPVGTFFAYHAVLSGSGIYGLALMHYLDRAARAALLAFRPALDVSAAEYEDLRYRLTTLPARPTLVFSTVLALLGVAPVLFYFRAIEIQAKLNTSPEAGALEAIVGVFSAWAFAALLYHTIRQLRMVSYIYTRCTQVNLFRLDPLYAFSGLTARTAVGYLPTLYAIVAFLPEGQLRIEYVALGLLVAAVAAVTFAWPLLGIHRLLIEEKRRLKTENGQRLEATVAELHRLVDARDLRDIDGLNKALTSLLAEKAELASIPTWPWEAATLRGVVTALVLPMILWLITRILERVLRP